MSVQDDSESDVIPVTCEKCGYEWDYGGEMFDATCPRCTYKTPTGLAPDDL